MQITEITASWGETVNLGDYQNARIDLRLTARLEPGEDEFYAYDELMRECRTFVQEQVDEALEAAGEPARYSPDPRYQVISTVQHRGYLRDWEPLENVVAIIPDEVPLPGDDWHHAGWKTNRKMRIAHARRVAAEAMQRHGATRLIDCSDGDLSRLPLRQSDLVAAEEYAPTAESPF